MASLVAVIKRSPDFTLRISSAKGLVRWEPANHFAKRARRAGSWSRRFVACAMSDGIVIVMTRTVTTRSAVKTIAMPRSRRIRRSSSHWIAGLMVPTMTRAATITRTTGRSRFSTHRPARRSSKAMMVPGRGLDANHAGAVFLWGGSSGSLIRHHVDSVPALAPANPIPPIEMSMATCIPGCPCRS